MFEITTKTTFTTDWAQLKSVQERLNLAEIMLEVGSEFPISLEADADNENDVFEQLTAQVVHVTKESRVMVVLKDCMEKMHAMNDYAMNVSVDSGLTTTSSSPTNAQMGMVSNAFSVSDVVLMLPLMGAMREKTSG